MRPAENVATLKRSLASLGRLRGRVPWLTVVLSIWTAGGVAGQPPKTHEILGLVEGLRPGTRATVALYSTSTRYQAAQQAAEAPPGLFWGSTPVQQVETDPDGFFSISAPDGRPGRVIVSAREHGVRQTWLAPVSEPLTLEAVTLPPAREVQVRATDPSGAPVVDAWVDVRLETPVDAHTARRWSGAGSGLWSTPPLRGLVDSSGVLRVPIEHQASGWVQITANGRILQRSPLSEHGVEGSDVINVALPPATVELRLSVVDSNGYPVAGAHVHHAESGPPLAITDASGQATFLGRRDSSWKIIGPRGGSATIYDIGFTPHVPVDENSFEELKATLHRNQIDVASHVIADPWTSLESTPPVSLGVVEGAWAHWSNSSALTISWLDSDLAYSTWIASAPGYLTRREIAPAANLPAFRLEPSATVTGTVASTSGESIARARVTGLPHLEPARRAGRTPHVGHTWTRADGSFVLTQQMAGLDRLGAQHQDFPRAGPTDIDALAPFELRQQVKLVLSRGRIAVGQVLGADGMQLAGARVSLDVERGISSSGRRGRRPRPSPAVVTDGEGVFRIDKLPGGAATLRVEATGHASAA